MRGPFFPIKIIYLSIKKDKVGPDQSKSTWRVFTAKYEEDRGPSLRTLM